MKKIRLSLLRGVCQMPAYVACQKGFFLDEDLEPQMEIVATAWLLPQKLANGDCQFAVMPWTRVAVAELEGLPLVLVAGSGFEEAAIVVRQGVEPSEVKKVAIPLRGGIKDLTAMGLIKSLGWEHAEQIRQPSGDGAIIALFGQGVDAASMVEPYATMMEQLGVGRVIRRTGDVWKGAPGCSLATHRALTEKEPCLVEAVVRAFARGVKFVRENHEESSEIASRYIGINSRFIRAALKNNQPDVDSIRNQKPMDDILALMRQLGYIKAIPTQFRDLRFLNKASTK
ncbi:MAG: ABC transporter substrate-binding protein [Verrucomicrobiae bacterium]|nr:ABC transporter substrate-binding protein [Verrucomicrobiae bacterium]